MALAKKQDCHVLVLSGGVGGAKLVRGFGLILEGPSLQVGVNTADDFDYVGLRICPDLDTVMYALAGLQHKSRGWGIERDSWNALRMLRAYGVDTWFHLGDRDLATHILRTALLRKGLSLSQVTARLAAALGIGALLYPMTNEDVRTIVRTEHGELTFQEYFVRERCEPTLHGIRFARIEQSQPTEGLLRSVREADLIVIAPSNPVVSIGPILAIPGFREELASANALKVAVSPIVSGRALKGPTVEMLHSLGRSSCAASVAESYAGLVNAFVLDERDRDSASEIRSREMQVLVTDIIMWSDDDKARLARAILSYFQGESN